jgi:class 3 adenylate cyclase
MSITVGRTPEARNLEEEIVTLRATVEDLRKENKDRKEAEEKLRKREKLSHILKSVAAEAHPYLFQEDSALAKGFEKSTCNAFVMSVDIRRSTELMLKATDPERFAKFIVDLCGLLRHVVLQRYGVFDKFTGDGILAFFPLFYSGTDAGYRTLRAASDCHAVFAEHYRNNRDCFNAVLNDTGLGIGIDFGQTHLVSTGGDLTVVGDAVVYACRFGGALPGNTLLNQRAHSQVFPKYSANCQFQETEIKVKEGPYTAYRVSLNDPLLEKLSPPEWLSQPPLPLG